MKAFLSWLHRTSLLLVLGLCLFLAPSAGGDVIRVDKDSTATNPIGDIWTDSFGDFESALVFARNPLNLVTEIWVANGAYFPTDLQTSNPRSATFFIGEDLNGIKIYGGFQGLSLDNGDSTFGETSESQRHPWTSVAVLSGDLGTENDDSDNAWHVVTLKNQTLATEFDGFLLTRGDFARKVP